MKQAIKWLSAATCAVFLLCGAVHARQIPGDESNASDGTPEVSFRALLRGVGRTSLWSTNPTKSSCAS